MYTPCHSNQNNSAPAYIPGPRDQDGSKSLTSKFKSNKTEKQEQESNRSDKSMNKTETLTSSKMLHLLSPLMLLILTSHCMSYHKDRSVLHVHVLALTCRHSRLILGRPAHEDQRPHRRAARMVIRHLILHGGLIVRQHHHLADEVPKITKEGASQRDMKIKRGSWKQEVT